MSSWRPWNIPPVKLLEKTKKVQITLTRFDVRFLSVSGCNFMFL